MKESPEDLKYKDRTRDEKRNRVKISRGRVERVRGGHGAAWRMITMVLRGWHCAIHSALVPKRAWRQGGITEQRGGETDSRRKERDRPAANSPNEMFPATDERCIEKLKLFGDPLAFSEPCEYGYPEGTLKCKQTDVKFLNEHLLLFQNNIRHYSIHALLMVPSWKRKGNNKRVVCSSNTCPRC